MCGVCKLVGLNQGPGVHRSAAVSGGEDLRDMCKGLFHFLKKSEYDVVATEYLSEGNFFKARTIFVQLGYEKSVMRLAVLSFFFFI